MSLRDICPRKSLGAFSAELDRLHVEGQQLLRMEQEQRTKVKEMEQLKAKIDDALVLMRLALKEQVNVKERLEDMATSLLQATFGPDFRFGFEVVENKAGMVTGLVPRITRHGIPRSAMKNGGGAANMSSTGLRGALHLLNDADGQAPVLMLDEPAANLDNEKWPVFVDSIARLAELTGLQLFLITHTGHGFPCQIKTSMPREASSARIVLD